MAKRSLASSFVLATKDDPLSGEADDQLNDLRKKLAIVKQALKTERKDHQDNTRRITELENTNSVLEVTLQEKEAQIRELQATVSNVEGELTMERAKVKDFISSPDKSRKNKGSKAALEQQNRRLLEEHHARTQRIEELESALSELRL